MANKRPAFSDNIHRLFDEALATDLAPGVVSMPLGQGHRRFGKFASDRGSNPFALLPDATDAATGAPAIQSTRVRIAKAATPGRLVRLGFPEGQWKPDQFIS